MFWYVTGQQVEAWRWLERALRDNLPLPEDRIKLLRQHLVLRLALCLDRERVRVGIAPERVDNVLPFWRRVTEAPVRPRPVLLGDDVEDRDVFLDHHRGPRRARRAIVIFAVDPTVE
jgi:hypothetical protein